MVIVIAQYTIGFVVPGQAFVVADGAARAGDPGEGPLDDPAAGQHAERVLLPVPLDDLECEPGPELGPGPGDELAGVAAVSPGEPDRRERLAQVPQQRLRAVAILDAGGGDQDGQQQPNRVDGDVPLAAVIFSRTFDHGFDLQRCDEDSVVEGVDGTAFQQGPMSFGEFPFGVSRVVVLPSTSAVRRSPRARARALRSCWLSVSRWRMRAVAASRRRSSEGSEARCRRGGISAGGAAGCRWRSRSTSARRSCCA